jgi:hypothetical protein
VHRLWETLSEEEKDPYKDFHDTQIRNKGLQAPLIDICASLEVRKIPIVHYRFPICCEQGDGYHVSNPNSFQEQCKRLHECTYLESRDSAAFTISQVFGRNITMTARGSQGQKLVRAHVLMCYVPSCQYHAITPGKSLTKHWGNTHNGESQTGSHGWAIIIAHIRTHTEWDATTHDLLDSIGCTCVWRIGVRSGRASEIAVVLRPLLEPRLKVMD